MKQSGGFCWSSWDMVLERSIFSFLQLIKSSSKKAASLLYGQFIKLVEFIKMHIHMTTNTNYKLVFFKNRNFMGTSLLLVYLPLLLCFFFLPNLYSTNIIFSLELDTLEWNPIHYTMKLNEMT